MITESELAGLEQQAAENNLSATDVRRLVGEVRRLYAALDTIRELHAARLAAAALHHRQTAHDEWIRALENRLYAYTN